LLKKQIQTTTNQPQRAAEISIAHSSKGQVVTGLMFFNEDLPENARHFRNCDKALAHTSYEQLNPGSARKDL
jgi:hypothetical protein